MRKEGIDMGFGVRVKKKLVGGTLKIIDYDIENIYTKKRRMKGGRK